MIILKADDKKMLRIVKSGNTFTNENNAEQVRIIVPNSINNVNILDCVVQFNVSNSSVIIDVVDLTGGLSEYDENFQYIDINVRDRITFQSGTLNMWLEVFNSERDMIAKTNPVSYTILPHIDLDVEIPDPTLTVLEQWTQKMNETYDAVKEIADNVEDKTGEILAEVSRFETEVNGTVADLRADIAVFETNVTAKMNQALDAVSGMSDSVKNIEDYINELKKGEVFLVQSST